MKKLKVKFVCLINLGIKGVIVAILFGMQSLNA